MTTEPRLTALEEAVARVGDRWTLLVVNSLLDGPRRFNELLDGLDGLAPNVLSKRLRQLETTGLVVATPYTQRPPRFDYRLTATGSELASALRLLAHWGAAGDPDAVPVHHRACGTPVEARWYCPTCARLVEGEEADDADETRFV
ncbi:MAG TPA: helix-turn-helix domain-containing protein [Acidimicrobiales bacterium]|jgi:DNA-binding HxlR family transcriptional regulator